METNFVCELCGKLISEEEYRRNDVGSHYKRLCYRCEEIKRKEYEEYGRRE